MVTLIDIEAWVTSKEKLDAAKAKEVELRLLICEQILDGKIKGSFKSTIEGYVLTATAKLNNKVDADLLKTIWEELSPEEKRCIKFKPNLIAKEYNKLKGTYELFRAVDSKPGTPSLAIKPTKV